jgi:hypothetical protein
MGGSVPVHGAHRKRQPATACDRLRGPRLPLRSITRLRPSELRPILAGNAAGFGLWQTQAQPRADLASNGKR